MSKLKITQVKSAIDRSARQKKTIEALGIRKLHMSVVKEDTPQIQGMIVKVKHLITVEKAEI
ncbi:MAG: 50S ribosomal protein L30 [Chitinophagales bacterium]|nr:50S ribosomal protein L30 [Chitinophagales bacterium]